MYLLLLRFLEDMYLKVFIVNLKHYILLGMTITKKIKIQCDKLLLNK